MCIVDSKSYLLYLANKGAIQRRRRVDDITAARNANAVGLSSYPWPLDLLPASGFNLFVYMYTYICVNVVYVCVSVML